jgi:hypothetical protein
MERFAAERVAELKDHAIYGVAPMSEGRWLITRRQERELLVVDGGLQPIWRLGLPSTWPGRHAVTDDLSLVALSLQDGVLLLSGEGREVARFAHPASGRWHSVTGCCAFAPDQRYLWATVPTQGKGDELWLVDVNQPSVVDRRLLETLMEGCAPICHPDGQTTGLSIGEGQDRSLICWARVERGRIQLRLVPSFDRILVDIHPSGAEYLSTPHDSFPGDELVRHRFVDDAPLTGSLRGTPSPLGASGPLLPGT